MAGTITVDSNNGLVYRGRYCPVTIEIIKSIPGRAYNPAKKEWRLPANEDVLKAFRGSDLVSIAPEALSLIQAKTDAREAVNQAKQVERPVPLKKMPLKNVEPFSHQIQAFNITLTLFGWAKNKDK